MAKADKVAAVADLREKFTNSSGAVLTEYRGLSVKALKQLRVSLGSEASYAWRSALLRTRMKGSRCVRSARETRWASSRLLKACASSSRPAGCG